MDSAKCQYVHGKWRLERYPPESHKSMEPGKLTTGEIECLRKVVEYLYDERSDYEAREPEDRENHIFKSVFVLNGVVNRQPEADMSNGDDKPNLVNI